MGGTVPLPVENNGWGGSYGVAISRIDQGLFDTQRDCEIRAAAPEGAFRLVEQLRRRRIRDRVDPRLSQNPARQISPVDIHEGSDLPGIGFAAWTVTNHQQLIRQVPVNRRLVRSERSSRLVIRRRVLPSLRRQGPVDHIRRRAGCGLFSGSVYACRIRERACSDEDDRPRQEQSALWIASRNSFSFDVIICPPGGDPSTPPSGP